MLETATPAPPRMNLGLCQPLSSLPDRHLDTYWMEPKLDGVRIMLIAHAGQVRLWSRAGGDFSGRLPAVENALKSFEVVLDGEVIWRNKSGNVDFHSGSGLLRQGTTMSVRNQAVQGWLHFVAWDVLWLSGEDTRQLPIEQRRELLTLLVENLGVEQLELIEQAESSPEQQADYITRYHEGVVLKLKKSKYPGGRWGNWLKLKVTLDADVVIMGLEEGQGKYQGTTGAVIFGQYRNGQLEARGTCSGMTDWWRDELWEHISKYRGKVLVIAHNGIERGGFRHPQWRHLRDDKLAEECLWD